MKAKIWMFLVMLLAFSASATLAEYTITSEGMFFSDVESVSDWTLPALSTMTCEDKSFEIRDPAGGRGLVIQECWSKTSPFSKILVKTRSYDSTSWKRCRMTGRTNAAVELICPRVYSQRTAK